MAVGDAPERILDAGRERLRAEHAEALEAFAVPVEEAVSQALAKVLGLAVAAASPALVAAGAEQAPVPPIDLDALSSITNRWTDEVDADVGPLLAATFEVAADGEWGRLAEAYAARAGNPLLPAPETLLGDLSTTYLATARNRLVGVGDTAWLLVRSELEEGMRAGEPIDALKARVEATLGVAEGRARTIARTETLGAVNGGQLAAVRLIAPPDGAEKEWLATGDARTRDTHWLADGQRVGLDDAFVVGGARLDYPGDPGGPAREVINCRCTTLHHLPPLLDASAPRFEGPDGSPLDMSGPETAPVRDRPAGNAPPPPPPKKRKPPKKRAPAKVAPPPASTETTEERVAREVREERAELARFRAETDHLRSGRWRDHTQADLEEIERRSTAIGAKVDGELRRRLAARGVPDPFDLDRQTREAQAKYEKATAAVTKFEKAYLRKHRGASRFDAHRDDGMEPLLDAAADARREWTEMAKASRGAVDGYRDAYSAELRAFVADQRPVGGARFTAKGIDRHSQGLTDRVATVYPDEWVEASNRRGPLEVRPSASRAHYADRGTGRIPRPHLLVPSRPGPDAMETAVHEFGHRMEKAVDGVLAMENVFFGRRRRPGEQFKGLRALMGGGYSSAEKAIEDHYAHAYMGKGYGGDAYELFTMGAQAYLSPEAVAGQSWMGAALADEDMASWFLGVLLNA